MDARDPKRAVLLLPVGEGGSLWPNFVEGARVLEREGTLREEADEVARLIPPPDPNVEPPECVLSSLANGGFFCQWEGLEDKVWTDRLRQFGGRYLELQFALIRLRVFLRIRRLCGLAEVRFGISSRQRFASSLTSSSKYST